ncbi:protein of unknown function [Alteribacillus persepolensis]|uniref:DUF1259 domain-containing protein n=1 Tax=Alteribacillus persepolensis TaxID=568899 RepID=A0A1G8AXZ9_9BACI|nr:DUF1259 domain-containing protein [Alteribacillus persepolensis]SDH25696.1 protein of unknown function [Alteribacillus persepolensis]
MSNQERLKRQIDEMLEVQNARQRRGRRHGRKDDCRNLCDRFAAILHAEPDETNGVCVAARTRDLEASIMGRETNSPLVFPQFFSFEGMDNNGNALNLGETVILQHEINPFVERLVKQNIQVTAIHNHWLFDDPRLMYIHFQSVEPPLEFAKKTAAALSVLKDDK